MQQSVRHILSTARVAREFVAAHLKTRLPRTEALVLVSSALVGTANAQPSGDDAGFAMPLILFLSLLVVILLGTCIALVRQNRRTNRDVGDLMEETGRLRQEVYHRVNNNLQVLAALVRMEQRLSEQDDTWVINRLVQRIETMAAVHQQLDPDTAATTISAESGMKSVIEPMLHRLAPGRHIDLVIDDIDLPLDRAFKIALIVGEIGQTLCETVNIPAHHQTRLSIHLKQLDQENLALAFENKKNACEAPNDETLPLSPISTRLVDLLLKDLGAKAASVATLNFNETFGVRMKIPQFR